MSLQFSNTTTKNGLIQRIEKKCGFDDGFITNNTLRMAQFTGDVNNALDKALAIIFRAGGTWQFDDSNHTKYNVITTDLVQGQRDYSFTTDEQGNLILEIYKVFVLNQTGGLFNEIDPVDVESERNTESFTSGQNAQAVPYRYDKMANGIFLDPVPNASISGGLKIYISREGSYFTIADTTKMPGFAGLFHDYLAVEPSYQYAIINSLPNAEELGNEMMKLEKGLEEWYGTREKDKRNVLSNRPTRFI
jgi:hypothetical protein